MSGRHLILAACALALIAVERLANAMLISSRADDGLTIRLMIAFVCGGAAPILFVFGYLKMNAARSAPDPNPPADSPT